MAVSVVPGSVLINVFEHPKVELPEAPLRGIKPFGPVAPAPVMAGFGCTQISMGGEVKLTGDEDEIAGCTLGFVQMQFVETFWCHYRGKTNAAGSMLIQRGLAPARKQQTCRDCLDKERSNIFLNVDELGKLDGPARPPVKLATGMEDQPNASALLGQLNSITHATNLLHEAQLERHFCAILTLQTPDGKFRHLASRYWNLRWQAIFKPSDFDKPFTESWSVRPVKAGMGAGVSKTILGTPGDPRFAKLMTEPTVPICNDLIKGAAKVVDNFLLDGTNNPDFDKRTRRESAVWSQFNVRR